MSPTKPVLSVLTVLLLTQCNSPPPAPPAQPVVLAPVVSAAPPVASVAPPPPAPVVPPKAQELPPLRLVAAGAVIVWIADPKARGGFRSALVEPAPDGAKVVAERPEVILASSKELWVLRIKKARAVRCAECDKCRTGPCTKNATTPIDEPYLQGLRTSRVLEPWSDAFVPSKGCADQMDMQEGSAALAGAVGTVIFASVGKFSMGCEAAHPQSESETLAFDLDTETVIKPTFPAPPLDELVERAHKELTALDCANPDDRPEPWEASAAYGAGGELHGVYTFTMAAPYYCGTGPGHYSILSEQTSPWIPPELAAYGKLPAFAASYMAEKQATFAMPIAPGRVAAAEKEMATH
jgi:hypothetical protein